MFKKSNLLGLGLSIALGSASFASDALEEGAFAKKNVSARQLQQENTALRAQMEQMQNMFAQFQAQLSKQDSAIEVLAKQPSAEEVAKKVVSVIRAAVLSEETAPGAPKNFQYIFVEKLVAQLNALREQSTRLGTVEEKSDLFSQVSELEEKLGITQIRLKKKNAELLSERKRAEEERQRQVAQHQETLEALKKEIDNLIQQIQTAGSSNVSLQRQLDVLKTDFIELRQDYTNEVAINEDLRNDRKETFATISDLKEKLKTEKNKNASKTVAQPAYN